ncbi:MAG: type III secretion system export apparatus subunit SctR [Deltaproteobacteria bacterium]|nr:type III secretion system export apparatus subunit SctR [Deltaproteobacteria bacterium]
MRTLLLIALPTLLVPRVAEAAGEGSSPVSAVLLLAALALLPFVLVMTTSFIKFSVVLSILRNALGTPQIPPMMVVTGLAAVLTIYVMAPTGAAIYERMEGTGKKQQAGKGASGAIAVSAESFFHAALQAKDPLRDFMKRNSNPRDRRMFRAMAGRLWPKEMASKVKEGDLLVVLPAFVIGQLAAAFKIGFLIFVPFLVIDLVVANVLLALGMHMLSPTTISLPFKLLLFVLVDGWYLITQGLVLSYATGVT